MLHNIKRALNKQDNGIGFFKIGLMGFGQQAINFTHLKYTALYVDLLFPHSEALRKLLP